MASREDLEGVARYLRELENARTAWAADEGAAPSSLEDAIATAEAALVPVTLEVGQVSADDYWDNGVNNLVRDSRDPFIVDPRE